MMGSGGSSSSGSTTIEKALTGDQKQDLNKVHRKLGNLSQIDDQIMKLQRELAVASDEDKEAIEEKIKKKQEEWETQYRKIDDKAKKMAQEGGDLMSQMMNQLAANMTLYRNDARRGFADYFNPFADPRKTWRIRENQAKIDHKDNYEARQNFGKTPMGKAMQGATLVTGTVLGGVAVAGGYLSGAVGWGAKKVGGGFYALGNAARQTGLDMRNQASNAPAKEDRTYLNTAYRAGQYLMGGAAAVIGGGLGYTVGGAFKLAGSAAQGLGEVGKKGVDAAVNSAKYIGGQSEHLVSDSYQKFFESPTKWLREQAAELGHGIESPELRSRQREEERREEEHEDDEEMSSRMSSHSNA